MTTADVLQRLTETGPQTVTELTRHFGYQNTAPVYDRLRTLDARGVVVRTPGKRGRRLWDVRR